MRNSLASLLDRGLVAAMADAPTRFVAASPSVVVRPSAELLGADELIGTEMAYDAQDRVIGAFATPNCRGAEKVVRLEVRFGAGLRLAAAYGDTGGDREMLAIADSPGYRVFTGRPG